MAKLNATENKNQNLGLQKTSTVSTKSKDTLTNDTTTVVTTTITTTEDGIYEPKVIHGMRKNGLNETELLVEWKGFVKPADWTWEERKEFEKSCPDIVGKWEKKEKGKGKAVQDRDFHEDGIYEVERIVKRMKVKGKCGYLVKWKDWNEGCNSWQEARLLRYDVPYLVEDFEKELELERKRKMGMEEEGEEEAGVIAKEAVAEDKMGEVVAEEVVAEEVVAEEVVAEEVVAEKKMGSKKRGVAEVNEKDVIDDERIDPESELELKLQLPTTKRRKENGSSMSIVIEKE